MHIGWCNFSSVNSSSALLLGRGGPGDGEAIAWARLAFAGFGKGLGSMPASGMARSLS